MLFNSMLTKKNNLSQTQSVKLPDIKKVFFQNNLFYIQDGFRLIKDISESNLNSVNIANSRRRNIRTVDQACAKITQAI